MDILVAIDGSKHALRAVKFAINLVSQLRATSTITLVSVHDDVGLRHAKALVGDQTVTDYLHEQSQQELKPACKLIDKAGIRYGVEIRTGHVAQEIVDFAKTGGFDLLVMGAKGRGAVIDVLLGSVAQRVLSSATVPVLLVK